MKIKTLDQLLDEKYGKKGSAARDRFEADSIAFRLGVMLKEARMEANVYSVRCMPCWMCFAV